ncbi:MAG TPA: response regulator [Thermoanaerobaculia bacterium]|nr:response regulator [Thermoanaerobaculia bacterium]
MTARDDNPLRVLVVDDSPEDRETYRRHMAGLVPPPVVESAGTAAEALLRLSAGFDCLLLDYQLPDANGLEVLAELAARPLPAPAVILLTGRGDEALAVEAMKRGAQDYLVKGRINGESLTRAVQHAVEKVALQAEVRRAYSRLEDLVRQRTQELELANAELRREIAERQRAEEARAELLLREREAREQAEAANRLKDDFLATLSHELRTPLNAILGWAAVLAAARPEQATVERAAAVIERNARAQSQLVSDLLDMSAIITGKTRLELQPVDVGTLLSTVADTVRPAALARRIDLRLEVPPELPPLAADPARLQQVVWNLLANAVKFTGEGGHVILRTWVEDARLVIEVRDDGIGIPAEFLPFVFDRFRQRDSSTTRSYGGLGLGLAIVRHLVEAHGGTVTAQSDGEGQGAIFRVELPSPPVDAVPLLPPPQPREQVGVLAGLRVLLVEDEVDSGELFRRVLEDEGAAVELVDSTDAALDSFTSAPPDVLVSDIGLPGEDGYALLRRVRELPAELGGKVPAAALTAYAGPVHAEKALQAGFAMHLAKPVTPGELVAAIASLGHRRRASDAARTGPS